MEFTTNKHFIKLSTYGVYYYQTFYEVVNIWSLLLPQTFYEVVNIWSLLLTNIL